MSEGPWAANNVMPTKKGKKPLEDASGHLIFSLLAEEVFSLSRRRGRGRPSLEHCLELLGWPASTRSLPFMEL